jgi:hypothetical protein
MKWDENGIAVCESYYSSIWRCICSSSLAPQGLSTELLFLMISRLVHQILSSGERLLHF